MESPTDSNLARIGLFRIKPLAYRKKRDAANKISPRPGPRRPQTLRNTVEPGFPDIQDPGEIPIAQGTGFTPTRAATALAGGRLLPAPILSSAEKYPRIAGVIVLVSMFPLYFALAEWALVREISSPALAIDHWLPFWPQWLLIYASLFVFLFLPVFVIRSSAFFFRGILAFLAIMLTSYVIFALMPTEVIRNTKLAKTGFWAWAMRVCWAVDPPFNGFPSMHVAESFLAALICRKVHRGLGLAALFYASLIAFSTLVIKQHYLVDVIGGLTLALAAHRAIIHPFPRNKLSDEERDRAPGRALWAAGIYGVIVAGFLLYYYTRIA